MTKEQINKGYKRIFKEQFESSKAELIQLAQPITDLLPSFVARVIAVTEVAHLRALVWEASEAIHGNEERFRESEDEEDWECFYAAEGVEAAMRNLCNDIGNWDGEEVFDYPNFEEYCH